MPSWPSVVYRPNAVVEDSTRADLETFTNPVFGTAGRMLEARDEGQYPFNLTLILFRIQVVCSPLEDKFSNRRPWRVR